MVSALYDPSFPAAERRCPVPSCFALVGPLNWLRVLCDRHWLCLSSRLRSEMEQAVSDMYDSGGEYPGAGAWERLQAEAIAWAQEVAP